MQTAFRSLFYSYTTVRGDSFKALTSRIHKRERERRAKQFFFIVSPAHARLPGLRGPVFCNGRGGKRSNMASAAAVEAHRKIKGL